MAIIAAVILWTHTIVLSALALIGAVTVTKWARECWRTRKDKPTPYFWWQQ